MSDVEYSVITSDVIKSFDCIISVILFGILGSYLFLHIWENIILKLGKKELKYMKLGK